MILWKDFILDDVCGPVLVDRNVSVAKPSVMDGAKKTSNQETSQVSEPARMVGRTDLEISDVATPKESGGFGREHLRQGGVG